MRGGAYLPHIEGAVYEGEGLTCHTLRVQSMRGGAYLPHLEGAVYEGEGLTCHTLRLQSMRGGTDSTWNTRS